MKKPNFTTFLLVVAMVILSLPVTSFAATTDAGSSKIKGSDVLVIGDSFLALSRGITQRLEQNAKNEGILDSNDKFRDNSVSGTMLSGGISPTIPTQYQNGVNAGAVKYVIMDGGGNDCLGGNVDNAVTAAKSLFAQMGKSGTVKVFYLFYPDPVGSLAGSLKPKLDTLRPQIQSIVTNSVTPKGYFLDLRPTFEGKYSQYILSDGIHPTTDGSNAAADAIWAEMKKVGFL
ncbi:MAG TPA: SGNH/GDSL hydrolase family protein [Ruminiclostridium sp.]|nr:SGNH/GDSL hydrolase family protein [Ruminiclostridium sp.]